MMKTNLESTDFEIKCTSLEVILTYGSMIGKP